MQAQNEPNLFEQLIARIDKVISEHPVTEYEVLESKIHAPLAFLQKFAKKELVLMHRFSANRVSGALKLIFNVTDKTLRKKPSWTFAIINRIAIYYALAASCCNSRPITENEEVADEYLGRQVIAQSQIIFGNEFGSWTHHIQGSFKSFLTAIGTHSSLIYNYFLNSYQSEIMNNVSLKQVAISLKPWIYMPGSINAVINFLKPIASNVNLITEKYREPFCQMVTNTLLMSFRKDPIAFSNFLAKRSDIMIAASISEQISTWNTASNPFTWPTQAALAILQPSGVLNNNDISKIPLLNKLKDFSSLKGNQQKCAFQAILVFFQAFTASNAESFVKTFCERYFKQFLHCYLDNAVDMQDDFLKLVKIDFPLAALMMNSEVFFEKVLPKVCTPDLTDAIYTAKIIKRFCKIANPFPEFSSQYIKFLIHPAHDLLGRPKQDPKCSVLLPNLIAALQSYPLFMRKLVFEYPDICQTLFDYITQYPEISQQFAYQSFFDAKFVDETPLDKKTIKIYSDFVSFLYKTYKDNTLYTPSTFGEHIPIIIRCIAENLLQILQGNTDVPASIYESIKPMLTNLETLSIIFFSSSKQDVRNIAITVLSSLCEIIHISESFNSLNMPLDEYQLLVTEARRETNLKTGSKTISNALKIISEPSQGITDAYEALSKYFMALSKGLNPKINLLQPPDKEIKFPIEYITQEWIGVCSVIFAIVFDQAIMLFQQMKLFLQDPRDVGQYSISGIPQAIAQRHLNPIITILLGYFRPLTGADNTFIVTPQNMYFVINILKLTRGICEQKSYWTPEMINIQIFGQFAKKAVSFCDVTQGEDCKLMCIKLLIAMFKLTNEKSKPFEAITRHSLGKTVLTWLPQSDDFSREFIKNVHEALALILDDLSLLDCVESTDPKIASDLAEQQFMFYFASIKSRLDNSSADVSMIIPVLAALLKQNLSIAIGHCISMGFEKNNSVRTAFIASVAAVFKVPETKVLDNESDESQDITLPDILFDGPLDLVELVGNNIPYSRAEAFGKAALEAALLKGRAYEYLSKMVDVELRTIDEQNKNTIFRGNAVPARTVGHWPRIVGMKWLEATLRPIFEDVIKKCEEGVHYIIDPSKIGAGENIEENIQNFRELLTTCVDAIYNAQEVMPEGLVYASQIIYQKVFEKVGEFAYNILSSFLFLRFIIPSFSATQMVGLPPLLPDVPRKVLLQTSTVIMASILKGKLDDKGEYLKPFNDIAKQTQEKFLHMFQTLVTKEVSHVNPTIEIDPDRCNKEIHSECYSIIPQLVGIAEGLEAGSDLQAGLKRFIQKIKQMGQPSSTSSKGDSNQASISAEAEYNELMQTQFPKDQIQQLSEAIYREEHTATDGAGIIYVHFNKLSCVKDPRIVAQLLFKAIMADQAITANYVCLILSGFDPSKIPNATMLLKYSEMPPVFRIRQYIVLEPPNEFAMFVKENPKIFSKPQRFEIIDSITKLGKIFGPIPSAIPPSTIETFTEPQAQYSVVMNGQQTKIRIHEHSLQVVNDQLEIKGFEFTPVKVIMADQIHSFTRNIANKNHPDEYMFNITMKNNVQYQMRVPLSSPLYDATLSLTLRSRTLNATINQVTIDDQTLHWLMLNFAFINIVTPTASTSIRKAALDLIYAVFVSFTFGKTITVQKMDESLLPDNMFEYVKQISTDIAENNQSSAVEFLMEFFKSAKYVTADVIPSIIPFIVPWVKLYARNPDEKIEIIEKLIDLYSAMGRTDQTAFQDNIWPIFANNEHCIRVIIDYIFKNPKLSTSEIVPQLAHMNQGVVSRLLVDEYLAKCIEEKSQNITLICSILENVIALHCFDFENCIAKLIYLLSTLRLHYPTKAIYDCPMLLTDIMHEIFRRSGKGKEIDYRTLVMAFISRDKEEEFKSGANKRTWPSKAHTVADILSDAIKDLGNRNIHQQIYDLFFNDINSEDKLLRAQAIIYSSAFSMNPDATASYLISILCADETIVGEVCLGLSLINMTRDLASKLFFVGCTFAIRYNEAATCDLIASAARYFGIQAGNTNTIFESVSPDLVTYLQTCTALPLEAQPMMSALLIIACYTDGDHVRSLRKIAECNTSEPVPATMRVINDENLIPQLSKVDYGADIANLTAALVLFLDGCNIPPLREFAISFFTEHPQGLGCFDVIGPKFGKNVLQSVNDARFTGLILRNAVIKSDEYILTTLLQQRFIEMPKIQLSKEQHDYLVLTAIPV